MCPVLMLGHCALQGPMLWCRQAIAEIDAVVDTSIPERDSPGHGQRGSLFRHRRLAGLGGGPRGRWAPSSVPMRAFRGQIRHDVLKAANSQVQSITDLS